MSTISKQLPAAVSPVAGGLQPRLAKEVLKINLVVLFLILMMLPLNIVNVMFYLKQSYACEVELLSNLRENFKITDEAPTKAFSWLGAKHKQALTQYKRT